MTIITIINNNNDNDNDNDNDNIVVLYIVSAGAPWIPRAPGLVSPTSLALCLRPRERQTQVFGDNWCLAIAPPNNAEKNDV